jgi:peptidoglycan DL-endopeptidase CwlO
LVSYAHLLGTCRATVAAGAAGILGLTLLSGVGYADPEDSIQAVARRVDRLHHEAEQASERVNTVRVHLQRARHELSAVRADFAQNRAHAAELQQEVAASAVAQFEGANLGTTAALISSADPDEFLSQLATVESIRADEGAKLQQYLAERRALRAQSARLHKQVAQIADAKQRLAANEATLDKKAAKAEKLLATLREKRREARQERKQARLEAQRRAERAQAASRSVTRPSITPAPTAPSTPALAPSSGAGAAAVAFALGQVGDPYVYGGAGPDGWDCSGLTMGAWAAAGVALPHSASMQTSAGVPVSVSALQPGDLVFYYSPISHVGIYIGNGQVVHAPHPGSSVEVVPLTSMPIAMAVRPG